MSFTKVKENTFHTDFHVYVCVFACLQDSSLGGWAQG